MPQTLTSKAFLAAIDELDPQLAVFDCDGTLWSGDAGSGFMHWTIETRLLSPSAIAWLDSRYRLYLAGELGELAICGEMVQVYKGLSDSVLRRAARTFFTEHIAPGIFPAMREVITLLQSRNVAIWAVSSTNDWVIEAALTVFNIPPTRILAAKVAIEDGIVTGRLLDVPTGEGKVAALARVGITQPDAVFGNSIHDAAMLSIARRAFPINPSPALSDLAAQQNWPIFFPPASRA